MQVTQNSADGLKREYTVVIDAKDMDQRLNERLKLLSQQASLPGFRPGKVPVSLLRKLHGDAVRGEVLEATVNETSQKALDDDAVRPATQPKIEIKTFEEGKDLEYSMSVEIMPDIEPGDYSKLTLEREVCPAGEAEIAEFLDNIAKQQKSFAPAKSKTCKAKTGDAVLMDFIGRIDGEAFEGGAAEGHLLELGSGQFIPGFEEQLVGVKAGDKLDVTVAFPENYGAENLAGKEAVFEVTIKEVQQPEEVAIDDALATRLGLETLDALKERVREQIEQELKQVSRMKLKRKLLDALSEMHDFEVPPGMVDMEFNQIWDEFKRDLESREESLEDLDKPEDEVREEYRAIAERRVRLGLLLAEIGRVNNIAVGPEEVNRMIAAEARRYPGQEQQVFEFYQKNPQAQAQIRAPLFEDKTVDFILEMANVKDVEVSREDLMRDPDEEEAAATPKKVATKKKASAKKTPAKKASAVKKTAAKKPAEKDA